MALAILLLVASLLIILLAAELFTNAVEWLGLHLRLNEGAVGSILAAVGTAMPETLIPLIAILFATGASHEDIGIGAILGAPFMLSTAAFCVTGVAVLVFARSGRRPRDMVVNHEILRRDMGYFLVVYLLAIWRASSLTTASDRRRRPPPRLLRLLRLPDRDRKGSARAEAGAALPGAGHPRPSEEASLVLSLLQFLFSLGS